jgi:hypothetical protein
MSRSGDTPRFEHEGAVSGVGQGIIMWPRHFEFMALALRYGDNLALRSN